MKICSLGRYCQTDSTLRMKREGVKRQHLLWLPVTVGGLCGSFLRPIVHVFPGALVLPKLRTWKDQLTPQLPSRCTATYREDKTQATQGKVGMFPSQGFCKAKKVLHHLLLVAVIESSRIFTALRSCPGPIAMAKRGRPSVRT